jgi:hypothetical protein
MISIESIEQQRKLARENRDELLALVERTLEKKYGEEGMHRICRVMYERLEAVDREFAAEGADVLAVILMHQLLADNQLASVLAQERERQAEA